jgi:hypothetical protein
VTFTLPYAGATRIRFEGLPDHSIHQALSPPQADTPSIEASLTEGRGQVKLQSVETGCSWISLRGNDQAELHATMRNEHGSQLECHAGVADDFAHGAYVSGVAMFEQACSLHTDDVGGEEQYCCGEQSAHGDMFAL